MGCTSTKQTSRNPAALKESCHDGVKDTEDRTPAATLLESQQNEPKTHAAAGAHEPRLAEYPKTCENPPAAEVSRQDRVTQVNSNVMLVEFTPREAEDEKEQPCASTPRKIKRKGTPWHGGEIAAINFADDELDDDDTKEDKAAEPGQPANEPVERSSMRKATPWHRGGETPESDLDENQEQDGKGQCKETGDVSELGSVFWIFEFCSRPCIPREDVDTHAEVL